MQHLPFFLLAGIPLLLAPRAQAQSTFSFGPQAGANLSTLHYPQYAAFSSAGTSRLGLEAGGVVAWQHRHWGFQSGLSFSQQGAANHARPYTNVAESIDYRFNYLRLPLSVTYAVRSTGLGFQVFAGPYLSLLVGGSRSYRSGNQTTTMRVHAGDSNGYNTQVLDTGLQGGLGYRTAHLLFQASGSFGLRNLSAEPNEWDAQYYSRGVRVSVAYLFGAQSLTGQ